MEWLISTSLLATLGFVMSGLTAAQKAAATPMRKSARKRETSLFALVGWAGAASSAICLAAILGAILVVTAAASAADSLVVFIKSFGTKNRPNLLCWAKTRWSLRPRLPCWAGAESIVCTCETLSARSSGMSFIGMPGLCWVCWVVGVIRAGSAEPGGPAPGGEPAGSAFACIDVS